MKRVGLLGGSFNPLHIAHLVMAEQVLNTLDLDEVRLMLTHIPPHAEGKQTLTTSTRLDMLRQFVSEDQRFSIETIELERAKKSYTYDTLIALREREPDTAFYFIMGADMVLDFPNWYRHDELKELATFVAVKRPGYMVEELADFLWIDAPHLDLSSSLIRSYVANGKSIKYLVPSTIQQFIETHQLYKEGRK
ncbi:nicotinate-nucleotide adenylyltransferase [Atopobacter phocae]|uniref:nicotinate-nucleotide adenylyltransferase n=1 Tax=Atopobacter phocae TaxID=136492 RepID=UPI000472C74D|nr:nicotinate-nucleotide adenylyltransferase [Atopobacter phocae]